MTLAPNDLGDMRYRMAYRLMVLGALLVSGCTNPAPRSDPPSLAPSMQPTASLALDSSHIPIMYHQFLAVDLPTAVRVSCARNLDIQEAQQRVAVSHGVYQSAVGAVFPSFMPNVTELKTTGAVSSNGSFSLASLTTFTPLAMIQWIINPGQVAYDIIASKRRQEASQHQADGVTLDAIRQAALGYYDLVQAQAQIAVRQQALEETEELVRIEKLKISAEMGLPADELRAEAAEADAHQELLIALNSFYAASLALTMTLHLDPTIMLVPSAHLVTQTTLVRDDVSIDTLLVNAVRYRPELETLRSLIDAANADKKSAQWGGLGPQVQATGNFGPRPPANSVADTMYRRTDYSVSGGFDWGAATFGRITSATARIGIAGIDLDKELDQVRVEVVSAHQASIIDAQAIPFATQQMAAAVEALRLVEDGLRVGMALTIDVLQAQDSADQARLRYASAIIHYNQSQVRLLAAVGVLNPTSLNDHVR